MKYEYFEDDESCTGTIITYNENHNFRPGSIAARELALSTGIGSVHFTKVSADTIDIHYIGVQYHLRQKGHAKQMYRELCHVIKERCPTVKFIEGWPIEDAYKARKSIFPDYEVPNKRGGVTSLVPDKCPD